jgi:hypothetical protein
MKPLGRPIIKLKRPKQDDYMKKVVDLVDANGTVLFRGTRQECLELSRKRAALAQQV